MKRKERRRTYFIYFLIFGSMILAGGLGFSVLGYYFFLKGDHVPGAFRPEELQNGDLVFRKGRSLESYAVYLASDDRRFSHVGIVAVENGTPWIIHALPGETGNEVGELQKEIPSRFLSQKMASDFAVFRCHLDDETRKKIAGQALTFFQKRLVFDNNYDLSTDHALYCTELIIKAFRGAGINLEGLETRHLNLLFSSFDIIFPEELMHLPNFYKVQENTHLFTQKFQP